MAVIVLRSVKGSPLTIAEADANFSNLNTEVGLKLDTASYTAADVLTKLKTVDGSGSGLDADLLDGLNASTSHIDSTGSIVARNTSGNFSANTITANLVGNVTGNVSGNLTGTVTGNSTNVDGTVEIEHGGTGANSVEGARTALGIGSLGLQNSASVNITGGTISGITDLAIADGGTGASNATAARTNLGLIIGVDVQPFSNELTAIAGATSSTGFYVRLGSGSVAERTLTAGTNGITITNGNGVAGNPVIDIPTSATMALSNLTVGVLNSTLFNTPSITKSGTSGTGDIGQSSNVFSTAFINTPSVTSIAKRGTSGTGNIGQVDNRFGVIYGTTTTATFADLAEKYTTDQEYETGSVLVVSMDDSAAEATKSWLSAQRVLGVVSEKPAFLMNDEAPGQALALRGRVPVKIVGPIRKGQPIISNQDGCGIYGDHQNSFAIALESNPDAAVKLVECVIL